MILSEDYHPEHNCDDQVEEWVPEIDNAVEPLKKSLAQCLPWLHNLEVNEHRPNNCVDSQHHYRQNKFLLALVRANYL